MENLMKAEKAISTAIDAIAAMGESKKNIAMQRKLYAIKAELSAQIQRESVMNNAPKQSRKEKDV